MTAWKRKASLTTLLSESIKIEAILVSTETLVTGGFSRTSELWAQKGGGEPEVAFQGFDNGRKCREELRMSLRRRIIDCSRVAP